MPDPFLLLREGGPFVVQVGTFGGTEVVMYECKHLNIFPVPYHNLLRRILKYTNFAKELKMDM